jgi:hypothetical protein
MLDAVIRSARKGGSDDAHADGVEDDREDAADEETVECCECGSERLKSETSVIATDDGVEYRACSDGCPEGGESA